MQAGKISISKFFKNRIWIVTFLILIMLLSIVLAFFLAVNHHIKSQEIEKILGIQITNWMFFQVFLIVLAFGILITMLFQLYKYIINPLNESYSGMSEIGITNIDFKANKTNNGEFMPTISEINSLFNKLKNLILLLENINKSESFDETMKSAFSKFSAFIPYQYIGIALISEDGKSIQAFHGISNGMVKGLPQKLLEYKVDIRDTSLAGVIERGEPRIINDLEKYTKDTPLKEYNKIILASGIRSSVTLALKINNKPMGVIFFSSIYKNVYNDSHMSFLHILANSIAISFNKNILINNILYGSTLALAKLAESRDRDTGGHLRRIGAYSKLIAQLLFSESIYKKHITVEYIKDIEVFSPLHDIGKVAIQDKILLKPGKLTQEEFDIMKTHAIFGAWILKEADDNIKTSSRGFFQMGIEIAEGHHEKWDGSGYPFGKKGEDIPLSARIVALADVFDALTSKRPYKEAFSFEKALEIIFRGSGTHFDPEIVRVLLESKDRIYEVYQQFSDGVKRKSFA